MRELDRNVFLLKPSELKDNAGRIVEKLASLKEGERLLFLMGREDWRPAALTLELQARSGEHIFAQVYMTVVDLGEGAREGLREAGMVARMGWMDTERGMIGVGVVYGVENIRLLLDSVAKVLEGELG